MMHPGRRHIRQHQIAANFVLAQQLVETPGRCRAAVRAPPRELTSDFARRTATYSKKLSVPPGASSRRSFARICSTDSTAKLFSGKPGDDQVVRLILRQVFDARVQQRDAVVARGETPGHSASRCAKLRHELLVSLDENKPVVGPHAADDLARDGAGAGADFENSPAA